MSTTLGEGASIVGDSRAEASFDLRHPATEPVASGPARSEGGRPGRWTLVLADLASVATALAIVAGYYDVRHPTQPPASWTWMTIAATVLASLAVVRSRDRRILGIGSEEFRRLSRAALTAISVTSVLAVATGGELQRVQVLVGPLVSVAAVTLSRLLLRRQLHRRRVAGGGLSSVLATGDRSVVDDLLVRTTLEPWAGWRVAGTLVPGEPGLDQVDGVVRNHGGEVEDIAELVRRHRYDVVAVLPSVQWTPDRLKKLAWALEGSGADLVVAPVVMEVAGPRLHVSPVFGMPMLYVTEPIFRGAARLSKELVDRGSALLGLMLLSPLFLVIAALVRATSPGPAFFRQERVGRDGQPFTMVKFRSMRMGSDTARLELVSDDPNHVLFKIKRDPRVTRVGAVLRRYSMDELPQLLNVLAGSMSLVGPRPPLADEVSQYAHHDHRRLLVKPGLTGLWQVSGRADLTWEESIRLDLLYVENWSMAMDATILWKTFAAVRQGKGAY